MGNPFNLLNHGSDILYIFESCNPINLFNRGSDLQKT